MALGDISSLDERIEELDEKLSDIAEQMKAIWSFVTSRKLAELELFKKSPVEEGFPLVSIDIDRLARRLGIIVGRGGGLSLAQSAVISTLESAATRAWQKFLAKSFGPGILVDFSTGIGVALIDSLFSAISKAIKPKKLNLPPLEPMPVGDFPTFASRRNLLQESTIRTKNYARGSMGTKRASEFTKVGDLIEQILSERLIGFIS